MRSELLVKIPLSLKLDLDRAPELPRKARIIKLNCQD